MGVRTDILPSEISASFGNTSVTVRLSPVSASYSTVDPIRTTFRGTAASETYACAFEFKQETIGNIGKATSRGERKFIQSLVIRLAHHGRRLCEIWMCFFIFRVLLVRLSHRVRGVGPRGDIVDRPCLAHQNRHHLLGRSGQPEPVTDQRRARHTE